jgi:hypothetical protein
MEHNTVSNLAMRRKRDEHASGGGISNGVVLSCVLLLFPVEVVARPCADVTVDQAFATSALIVKGITISTTSTGGPGSDSTSVIRIVRVLKGATTQPEIAVTHYLCGIEYSLAIRKGRPLLAFVDASGHLVNGTAVLPASSGQAAADGLTDATTRLRNELLLAATDEDVNTVRAAVGALAELDGSAARPTLLTAANRADVGVQIRALTWLTRFGDADAFDRLASILESPPFTPPAIPTTIRDDRSASLAIAHDDINRVLWSFAARDSHVATVPSSEPSRFVQTMMKIARSQDTFFRQPAIHALRAFRHPASFPLLVEALDDPDRSIRYNAMITLCMAMNAADVPCPSVPLFEKDEQKYIGRVRAHWKSVR